MHRLLINMIITGVLILTFSAAASGQALVNYQGRLTDPSGNPVADGDYAITFSLWDDSTAGVQQWTETHSSVSVTHGLFAVNLGSVFDLDESVFETEPLFLQIKIETGDSILPRTRLTSVPSAVAAKKVAGDIETSDGQLNLNAPDGDVAVSITTEGKGSPAYVRMFNPDPGFPEQKLLQLSSSTDGSALELYPSGEHPPDPCIYMGVEPTPFKTAKLEFYDPAGTMPNDPYIRMGFDPSPFIGAEFEIYDPGSGWVVDPMIRMGVEPSPFHKAALTMYNPQPESQAKIMELDASETDTPGEWRGALTIYDGDAVDPSPLAELNGNSIDGARFNLYNTINKYMGFEPCPFNEGGLMKMYDPATGSVQIQLRSHETDGASLDIYDEIGQVMGFDPTPFNPGYGLSLYDPSSASALMNIYGTYGTKGTNSSILMYCPTSVLPDSPMVRLEASGDIGLFRLGQVNSLDDTLPVFYTSTQGYYSNFAIKGGRVLDELGPIVSAVADQTEAKLGIGHSDPPEALYVVGNIVATGTITALTDTKVKTNVAPIENALGLIDNLRGVRYDSDPTVKNSLKLPDSRQIGLIAQEVETVLPEIVSTLDDGYRYVDYSRLTAVLVEAVKELKAENEKLKARLDNLENK